MESSLAKVMEIKTIETDGKGFLSVFEGLKDIPFNIERIYYIYGVAQGVKRGGHAHRALKQLLFCTYGAIDVTLDDGRTRESIQLDNPHKGLLISNMVWREMTWREEGSVLTVAASACYDESDYIRDYSAFLKLARA